ncbi:MAG: AMP-binding protein, partial [bacterium]|nr:AMP-binding protein [bacterium]
ALAAFAALLHRYTGQPELVVGSPVANRGRAGPEGLIGRFINTLVMRCDLTGDPSFEQLLARVRRAALAAYGHQDLPFERLVDELQPERNMSISPLFQVMFVLQNAPSDTLRMSGLHVEPLAPETTTAKFDMTAILEEGDGGLRGVLEYNTDLFDRTTMKRLIGHLRCLPAAIVAAPGQRLSELPWLSAAERHQLRVEWNDTETAAADELFLELFAGQVERTPEAVAVVWEGLTLERLSYAELDRRANHLACTLRTRGVGAPASRPEDLIGIFLERSPEMVIAILGILKAGGAWLPLDPEYPRERLAFMVADARPGVILTRDRLVDALPDDGAQIVCLDSRAGWQGQTTPAVARTPSRSVEVPEAPDVKKFALVCP